MKKQLFVLIVFLNLSSGFSQDSRFTNETPQISGGAEFNIMLQEAIRNGNVDMFRSLDQSNPPLPYSPSATGSFDGFGFDDNSTENGSLFIPPDPSGAAGTDRLIAVVNTMIEARDKTGGLLWRDALKDFFSPLAPANATFDPKVVFDHYESRFVVVTLERVAAGTNPSAGNISRILLAVSKSTSPTTATAADWHYTAISAKTLITGVETWADYPGFEVDEEAIYITNNMFAFPPISGFGGVRLWIVDKHGGGDWYATGLPPPTSISDPYAGGGSAVTTMPALVFGPGGVGPGIGTFLVGYSSLTFGGGPGALEAVQVVRVDDPLGAGGGPFFVVEFPVVGDLEDVGGVFGFPALPDAPQSGTAETIEVNDSRALDAVWRDGHIWLTTTINPNAAPVPPYIPAAADIGTTTAHWFRLDASLVTSSASPPGLIVLSDQGDIGGEDIAPTAFTFFPSVAVNSLGNAKFGFSASASSIFAGAYVAGREAGDAPSTVQPTETVHVGLDYYIRTFDSPPCSPSPARNRWGDYSGISLDPTDDKIFWVFNEYASTRGTATTGGCNGRPALEDGRWGTAYGKSQFPSSLPNVWINEFHYDNISTDAGEFIEVVLQSPGSYTLTDFTVTLYNGATGATYGTPFTLAVYTLGGTDPNDISYSYYYYDYPTDGIQNGAPDGICLDYKGFVILFISYEGSFTATSGPADGMTSIDIGVSQSGTTPVGSSLGLTGAGTQYSDFTWVKFDGTATKGAPNGSQTLPVELTSFFAAIINGSIKLKWRTETEVNNYGFEIQRSQMNPNSEIQNPQFQLIGFIEGHGNSNSPKEYNFLDEGISYGSYAYRLKQIDNDGTFEYSEIIEVDAGNIPDGFVLEQNYPNPFNPSTKIKFAFDAVAPTTLKVYDILGNEVAQLFNKTTETGKVYEIEFDASGLSSGVYYYRLSTPQKSLVNKMLLLK